MYLSKKEFFDYNIDYIIEKMLKEDIASSVGTPALGGLAVAMAKAAMIRVLVLIVLWV